MKKITIHQNDGSKIVTYDDNNESSDQIRNKLSELFKMPNIATIVTTHGSAIIRPSEVKGIYVEDVDDGPEIEEVPPENVVKCETKKEIQEDIITDMDN